MVWVKVCVLVVLFNSLGCLQLVCYHNLLEIFSITQTEEFTSTVITHMVKTNQNLRWTHTPTSGTNAQEKKKKKNHNKK